jgi:hypothetical protein
LILNLISGGGAGPWNLTGSLAASERSRSGEGPGLFEKGAAANVAPVQ